MTSPSDIPTFGQLQVSQDMRFQQRMWRVQRFGWATFAVIVVAALLGLLGDGPLSESSARATDAIEVRYGRVERHRSPSTLVVWVATAEAADGKVDVWLDREFVDRLRIETVTPEPESIETSSTRVTYTFEVEEAEPRALISFAVLHQGIGSQRGLIGIPGGPSLSFRQFILP